MVMMKIVCAECGLAGTHILGGDRGVTSFPADESAVRCPRGRAAVEDGDLVAERVLECPYLQSALSALVGGRRRP